jgi:hypothetical protein
VLLSVIRDSASRNNLAIVLSDSSSSSSSYSSLGVIETESVFASWQIRTGMTTEMFGLGCGEEIVELDIFQKNKSGGKEKEFA